MEEKKYKIFQKLEQLAELVPTPFYWVKVDSTILGANKLAIDLIKEVSSSCKTIIGKTAFDMYPTEAAQELINNNKKTAKKQKPLLFEETVTDIKTGKQKFRNVIRSPLYEDGKVVGILILVTDVTEYREKTRFKLEEQLKFKKLVDQTAYEFKSPLAILLVLTNQCSGKPKDKVFETLSVMADLIPISLFWFDENNILLSSNKWDSESVGGKFVGKTPFDYFPHEIANNLVKNNRKVMEIGKILCYEEQLFNNVTGEINYYRAFKAPLYDDHDKAIGVLGTSANITIEKQAERLRLENELQKVKLKEQDRYECMISQLVHDIRSPLASLSIITKTCKRIPEQERITLSCIADRITDIANNLLKSYKNSTNDRNIGKTNYQQKVLVSLSLANIVSEKRKQYQNAKVKSKICLNIDRDCEFLFTKTNELDFERMISNLISNAVEAIESRQGKIQVNIGKNNNRIKVTIEDNGKGMSQEIIDKIVSGVAITSNKQHGHGIGLTQVTDTLKASNAQILINSVVGKGTKITLLLPIIDMPAWIAQKISLPVGSTVVILDDDPSIHSAWDVCFKKYKDKVHLQHFKSAEKTINFIKSHYEKDYIFLLADFELLDQNTDGIQVIEKTAMQKQALLVTSYYNRPQVIHIAAKFGIKILPKQLSHLVPIEIYVKK